MQARVLSGSCIAFFLLFLSVLPVAATDFWTGAGVDKNWSTPGNWEDGTIPANPETTVLYFTQEGVGLTNIVDQDWNVRYIICSNEFDGHTFDLASNRLTITDYLMVGRNCSNSLARIRNGTLQLGAGTRKCSIYSGYRSAVGAPNSTNCHLVVSGNLVVSNFQNIFAGYGNVGYPADGVIDLSDTTISSHDTPNILVLSNLYVAHRTMQPSTLLLPPTLEVLELAERLQVGSYGYPDAPGKGLGILDFGDGSSLTNLRVRGDFLLGIDTASGVITNLPVGVHLEVGQPGDPRIMKLSAHDITYTLANEAKLAVSNGRFTAYLKELHVGVGNTSQQGSSTGVLDLATCDVQIGPQANAVTDVAILRIGDTCKAYGLLKLPPAITAISVGRFVLGQGSVYGAAGKEAQGFLDIGSNSQLRAITATNGFYWATENGKAFMGYTDETGAFVDYTPTGLNLTVGSPDAAVPFHMAGGSTYYWTPYNTGALVLVNGAFNGWVSDFFVGFVSPSRSGHPNYGFASGLLDLRESSVAFNGVTNSVTADRMIVGGNTLPLQSGAKGQLLLPASVTNFAVARLSVGCGGSYTTLGGHGCIDFGSNSQLRSFSVASDFWMGAQNGATGQLANLPTQNWSFAVGSPEQRGSIILGSHDVANYAKKGEALLTLTGATVSAHLTNLWIGASVSTGVQGGVNGRLDLSASTLTALDVDGPVIVGMGSNTYASSVNRGLLALPAGSASFGSLQVGNLNITNTSGWIVLNGTTVAVSNRCLILPSGLVSNHVGATSSGLDILNSAADALAGSSPGRLHLVFEADPASPGDILWGLRWNGDHRTELATLVADGTVTWDTNALSSASIKRFGVHYDYRTEASFIGVQRSYSYGSLIQIQ